MDRRVRIIDDMMLIRSFLSFLLMSVGVARSMCVVCCGDVTRVFSSTSLLHMCNVVVRRFLAKAECFTCLAFTRASPVLFQPGLLSFLVFGCILPYGVASHFTKVYYKRVGFSCRAAVGPQSTPCLLRELKRGVFST